MAKSCRTLASTCFKTLVFPFFPFHCWKWGNFNKNIRFPTQHILSKFDISHWKGGEGAASQWWAKMVGGKMSQTKVGKTWGVLCTFGHDCGPLLTRAKVFVWVRVRWLYTDYNAINYWTVKMCPSLLTVIWFWWLRSSTHLSAQAETTPAISRFFSPASRAGSLRSQ